LIYFIQSEAGGPIKIGLADDPGRRLHQIQFYSPVRLCIMAVIDGEAEVEAELHDRFAGSCSHGEWFHPTEELLTLIQESGQPWIDMVVRGYKRTTPKQTHIYCNPEFKAWVVKVARRRHLTLSALVGDSMASLATEFGYPPPPDMGEDAQRGPRRKGASDPAFIVKADPEWRAWVNGFAGHLSLTVCELVRRALRNHADREGLSVA
jgi:hypothetical protein